MSNLHKAVIKGNINRKFYEFGYEYFYSCYSNQEVYETTEKIKEEVIWEGELDLPIMKSDDRIYIKELDLTVLITDCLRTTENKYEYSTSYVIETIEDEKTEETRLKALEDEKKHLEFLESLKKLKEDEQDNPKKPWYKRLFTK